jgi:outer membrane protein OmpA-like peptidoglycan-associated protein
LKRKIFIIFMLFFIITSVFCDIFRFKYNAGDKYRLITEVIEEIYINDEFLNNAEILNKISVEILETNGNSGFLSGDFQVSEKKWNSLVYEAEEEASNSMFWRDEFGVYDIENQYLYPIVRNLPVFPDNDFEPGDTWSAEGEEVHDLSDFGYSEYLKIPITVYYEYVEKRFIDGTEVAVLNIEYICIKNFNSRPAPGEITVYKITGNSQQEYLWDIEKGRAYSYSDQFDFLYIMSTGDVIRFTGTSNGRFIDSEELNKDEVADDIQDEIDEQGLDDVTVTTDDEGVIITLENIQFMPDSYELMESEKEKLDQIGEILNKYPDRDLLITGHTAYAGIMRGLQKLSEDRARAVAEYLLSLGVRESSEVVTQGMGPDMPIADNSTEEGKQRNRRVEIKILEN